MDSGHLPAPPPPAPCEQAGEGARCHTPPAVTARSHTTPPRAASSSSSTAWGPHLTNQGHSGRRSELFCTGYDLRVDPRFLSILLYLMPTNYLKISERKLGCRTSVLSISLSQSKQSSHCSGVFANKHLPGLFCRRTLHLTSGSYRGPWWGCQCSL